MLDMYTFESYAPPPVISNELGETDACSEHGTPPPQALQCIHLFKCTQPRCETQQQTPMYIFIEPSRPFSVTFSAEPGMDSESRPVFLSHNSLHVATQRAASPSLRLRRHTNVNRTAHVSSSTVLLCIYRHIKIYISRCHFFLQFSSHERGHCTRCQRRKKRRHPASAATTRRRVHRKARDDFSLETGWKHDQICDVALCNGNLRVRRGWLRELSCRMRDVRKP
jgi:hypothetical protein